MNKQGQLEITVNAEQPDVQNTVSNNVITAVKTGDSNNILLYNCGTCRHSRNSWCCCNEAEEQAVIMYKL